MTLDFCFRFRSLLGAAVLLAVPVARADVTLRDGPTEVLIDPNSSAGLHEWWVAPVSAAQQNWFWYRIGNNPERSIDTISSAAIWQVSSTTAVISFTNSQVSMELTYLLTGVTPTQPYTSSIDQEVDIQNRSGGPLDFHLFEFGHFQSSASTNDTAELIRSLGGKSVGVTQQGYGTAFGNLLDLPRASGSSVSAFPGPLVELTNNVPDALNGTNTSAGPGDVAWALEWDFTLAADASVGVFETKYEDAGMPEPSVGALVLAPMLIAWRRRRRSLRYRTNCNQLATAIVGGGL